VPVQCGNAFFYWLGVSASPAPGVPDSFSLRTVRDFNFSTGQATLDIIHEDGIRVYVDGMLTHSQWTSHSIGEVSVPIQTTPGWHRVTVEFFDELNASALKLTMNDGQWFSAGPWPALSCPSFSDWTVKFYDAVGFDLLAIEGLGTPSGPVRGSGCVAGPNLVSVADGVSPAAGVPDNFSAIFQRDASFAGGLTTFTVSLDDGLMIYIDDVRVMDDWTLNLGSRTLTTSIPAGTHRVRVLYHDFTTAGTLSLSWS
jgi:hypothetical protein